MDPALLRVIHSPARLAALRETELLDTPPEASFDRLARLAARVLDAPLALVNLVDDRRQFSKSCFAPPAWPPERDAPLADSFCKFPVATGETVAIPDARLDARVRGSAMVTELALVSYAGVPLVTSGGLALGTLCVADFRERTWSPDELQMLADLAAPVLTEIELRRHLARRRAVERRKDEFMGVLSHEIRTPLTSIRGSIGLLAAGGLGELNERGRRMVELARRNAERLMRLIDDILDAERLETGQVRIAPTPLSVRGLMGRAADAVEALAERHRVPVEVAPADATVHADEHRMVQVLVNLLSNAVKFSRPGSPVRLSARVQGDRLVLAVEDRGRGIPADALQRVFGRFEQVEASDSGHLGGIGLGLPIARAIVEAHGGRIRVESTWGAGSTFFVELPLAPAGEEAGARRVAVAE